MMTAKNLFITGKPGTGKTTLIRETSLPFRERVGGFYTEEMRAGQVREGFRLTTFDGDSGVLARKGLASSCKINKYGVDLAVLEGIASSALARALTDKDLIIIDEVGSMEVMSDVFRAHLMACLNSGKPVLATIRYNAQPFTDSVKRLADTKLLCLTRATYIDVKMQVKTWLETSLAGLSR